MDRHLSREQIAALLDDPSAVADGAAHLDACAECATEFEGMSRTRMALSALPDLAAPLDGWERVRSHLPSESAGRRASRAWFGATPWSRPLAAAAIVLLFLGGMGVGRMIAPAGNENGGFEATAGTPTAADQPAESDRPTVAGLDALTEYPDYVRTVADLRDLRGSEHSPEELATNPALAAEHLTRLDALIDASKEALRIAPADPALNDFLFDVVDERASVAGRLDQTLRQASMEY